MPVTPYWIDFAQQPQGGDNRRGSFWGPWEVGSDLYVACDNYTGPAAPPNVLRIYKSTDQGVTWVEQDVANEPGMDADLVCSIRDGNTIRIGRWRSGTLDFAFRDFSLVTGTYGADYGLVGAPAIPNQGLQGMLVLSNGAFRIFYQRSVGAVRSIYFADYLAGGWTINQLIFTAGVVTSSQPGLVYLAGLSHGFYSTEPIPGGPHDYYHYSITDPGVVTIDGAPCYSDFTGNAIFNALVVAGDLKVSHRAEIGGVYYPALLTGTPAANPAWSTETVEQVNGTTAGVWATELAGEIRVWWGYSNFGGAPPTDQFYYSIRQGLGWSAPVVYWDRLASPPVLDPNPPGWHWLYGPSIMVFSNGVTFGGWYGVVITADADLSPMTPVYLKFVPPAPPAPSNIPAAGSRRTTVLVPNLWDKCLEEELRLAERFSLAKPCCQEDLFYDVYAVRLPGRAIPFRKVAAIPTPLPIDGDVTVLDFEVPHGYDGVLSAVFHLYNGPGFAEGGGDLVWRILVNRIYAKHMGNILFTLGSIRIPYALDGGVKVQSGQRIRYIVTAPNLSGGILPINSQIMCGVEGAYYARA